MLNIDAFYRACDQCETNLFVHRSSVETLTCAKCDRHWFDAEFDAVFEYPLPKQRIYIHHRYGGYSFAELAHVRQETETEVKGIYHNVIEVVAFDEARRPAIERNREVTA